MIATENVTIRNKNFIRTYSDAGKYITRDGYLYEEAVDPLDSGRVYEETDEDIPSEKE